jgi:hypothetical protein
MPTLTPPRPRVWPLNSSHAQARSAPALRCGCTLVCTPRQVIQNTKCGLFPLPRCPRRAAPWTRAGMPAHLYDSGTCMRRCCGGAARCYRRHMLRRLFCCTHPSSTACVSKRHQRATLLASAGLVWPRCSPPSRPVLRWRAWLLSCGSFAAKSPSAIFLASWANTRRKSQHSFFGGKKLGKYSQVPTSAR